MRLIALVALLVGAVAFDLWRLDPLGTPIATMSWVVLMTWVSPRWRGMIFTLGLAGLVIGFGILWESDNILWRCNLGDGISVISLIAALSSWICNLVDAHRAESRLPPAQVMSRSNDRR